jgi:hypothetical protein
MRVMGMITTVVVAAVTAAAVAIGVRSIPDIKRYLKIRQM